MPGPLAWCLPAIIVLAGTAPGAPSAWPYPVLWVSLAMAGKAPNRGGWITIIALGLLQDLVHDAPSGCWVAAALVATMIARHGHGAGGGTASILMRAAIASAAAAGAGLALIVAAAAAGASLSLGDLAAGLVVTLLLAPPMLRLFPAAARA